MKRTPDPAQCSRCHEPLADGAIIGWSNSMIEAPSSWGQTEVVCAACARPCELAEAEHEQLCDGCGLLMRGRRLWAYCSERCRQRVLRADDRAVRWRLMSKPHCLSCKQAFEPTRSDALCCSKACRQRAYRHKLANPRARVRKINRSAHELPDAWEMTTRDLRKLIGDEPLDGLTRDEIDTVLSETRRALSLTDSPTCAARAALRRCRRIRSRNELDMRAREHAAQRSRSNLRT